MTRADYWYALGGRCRAALRRWPTAEDLFMLGDRVVFFGALAILFFILIGGIS